MNSRSRHRQGFTLLEVLLVLAILVILGGAATFSITRMQRTGYRRVAANQINLFKTGLGAYRIDVGIYPRKEDGLNALISPPASLSNPQKWAGPYLDEQMIPVDPWDNPYQYELLDEDTYHIWSFGPNLQNEQGGGDDISNMNKQSSQGQ